MERRTIGRREFDGRSGIAVREPCDFVRVALADIDVGHVDVTVVTGDMNSFVHSRSNRWSTEYPCRCLLSHNSLLKCFQSPSYLLLWRLALLSCDDRGKF